MPVPSDSDHVKYLMILYSTVLVDRTVNPHANIIYCLFSASFE